MGQSSLPAASVGASKFSSRGIIEEERKGEKRGVSKGFLAQGKEKKENVACSFRGWPLRSILLTSHLERINKIPRERIWRKRLVSYHSILPISLVSFRNSAQNHEIEISLLEIRSTLPSQFLLASYLFTFRLHLHSISLESIIMILCILNR